MIEQEHRLLAVLRNWWRYRDLEAVEDATAEERQNWLALKRASGLALAYRVASPALVAAGGTAFGLFGLGVAVLGLLAALWANEILVQQNEKFDRQNKLVEEQNQHFREQNKTLQEQIEMQSEQDYVARRAALLATLYDRKETCSDSEKIRYKRTNFACYLGGVDCGSVRVSVLCPARADTRAREEALRAFVQIERRRSPLPLATLPNEGPEPPRLSLRKLDQANAHLEGIDLAYADLRLADLRQAILNDARLHDARLAGAYLEEAQLMRADLAGADLEYAGLRDAILVGARLQQGWLKHADLRGANVGGANLGGAILKFADLQGASLPRAYLRGTDLEDANLGAANRFAAYLEGANLSGADLSHARLEASSLEAADLTGTSLRGADLREAFGLTQEQLAKACGDDATKLPKGRSVSNCGPESD